jgi:hypothetical protein
VSTALRNAVGIGLLVAGGWFAVDKLADATQTRPDHRPKGSRTEIVFAVETKRYRQSTETAAQTLWGTCSTTVSSSLVGGVQPLGDGDFRIVLTPGLGKHAKERVLGCLDDLTLDRVRSHVERVTDTA